jgi:FecR protein
MRARLLPLVWLLAVLPAWQGGDRPNDRPDRDPPSRVGRLSFLSGAVSFRPGDVDDWTTATVNYPLHNGDHLWTDSDARAEITVGSTAFRLAPQTAFGFLALDDRTLQIRLSQGSLNVRVRDLAEDETLEIDTPGGAVSLLRTGTYRVDVDSSGDTTSVTVRRGEAEVSAAGSAFPVHPEQTAMVVGGDAPTYDVRDAIRSDDWEDWCAARDRRWDDARSARYVSHDVIGYEDLDDNGEWRDTPDYGAVWIPHNVVAGWAPYRYGHWAWVEPWGWTWIDDAPWGFAPFHYGRWVYFGGGWAWVPGRVVARPVYAPALVVFVGGRNWSVAIGAGQGVAWFPLGPEEPYVPAYHVSNTYVRNVNVTNVTNITNVTNVTNVNVTNINYRNRREPDAVTVVTHETFVESRPVSKGVVVVPRERLEQAPVVGFAARVVPTRQSVLAQPTVVEARRPPAVVTTREVIVRRQPPPAPVPFAAREQALRAHPGRPLDNTAIRTIRASTPTANPRSFVRPASPERRGQEPAPVLKPAREGAPPTRSVPPTVIAQPEGRRPPAPVTAPTRAPAPAPAPARPPKTAPTGGERGERPDRGGRQAAPPQAPAREQRPAPERSRPAERAASPNPAPPPARPPAAQPPRAEPQRQQPERRPRPDAERRPERERKPQKDSTKEKTPS